jgi:autotransporter translocation and assembly factor TamB
LVRTEKNKVIEKKRTLFHKIVNIFLYSVIGLLIVILLFFGVSQTSTFREYLRKTVIEQANKNLNGTIYIGKIDGTIFTSLILRNTVLNMGKDTLLNADKIELRTSPLQLLLKKIKIRKFEIVQADISLIADSTGSLNISKLTRPSITDTSKSTFPFKIEVTNFNLININFNLQRFDFAGSKAHYDVLNVNDLRVNNLKLSLNAFADISNNEFELDLAELSFMPNINNFTLEKLSGQFAVNKRELFANNLKIKTSNSEILLKIKASYNIFDSKADFAKAKLDLYIYSSRLNFQDVSPFVPSLNLFKESLAIKINCDGTLKDLTINQIDIKFLNSHLETTGVVKNLDYPKQMFFNAKFKDTYVNQPDISKLLPTLNLPVYEKLGVLRFDTLTISGHPLNFTTNVSLKTDKGRLLAEASLNFEQKPLKYNIKFGTIGVDISPFTNIVSNLNCNGTIKGSGTKPDELNAEINFNADGSVLNGNRIDNFSLTADAKNKNIDYDLNLVSDSSSLNMNGYLTFNPRNEIAYKVAGEVKKLDIYRFVKDSSLISNLNFSINAEGDGFSPDNLNLYLTFLLKNSTINGIFIDSTRAIADIRKNTGNGRVINLISDLADITVTGDFTISNMVDVLTKEVNLVSRITKNKIDEVLPSAHSIQLPTTGITPAIKNIKIRPTGDLPASMKYLFEFKDFALLSLFLGNAQIEINGEMSGELRNTRDSIYFSYNTMIDYLKYHNNDDVFFLSKLNLDFNVGNAHQGENLENLLASLHLKTDRIFTGADIRDIQLDVNLKNKIAGLNFSSTMENASIRLDGAVDISNDVIKLFLDTLDLSYNGFRLINKQKNEIDYARNDINFKNFVLGRDSAELIIKGTLSRYNTQNLNISLNNIKGRDIDTTLMQLQVENAPDANISCTADISGNFTDPMIKFNLNVNNITYKNNNFGSFIGGFNYLNKNLALDFKFISQQLNPNDAALKITGNLPIDLEFSGAAERLITSSPLNIKFAADNFNLGAFGDILPVIKKLRGTLKSNFEITGTYKDLKPNGFIELSNVLFVVESNNIEYNAQMKATIQNQNLNLENLVLQNIEGEKDGGKISGSGTAVLNGFKLVASDFNINGDLKVLNEGSKSASPSIYGDLVIGTNGNVEFKMNEDGAFLKAPIIVKKAMLTLPPSQGAYRNTMDSFIYKYLTDTTLVKKTGMDFESLVNYSKKGSMQRSTGRMKRSYFNYNIDVTVQDGATIIFVLYKELDQNLTAVLKGDFLYERIDGKSNAQGELTLMEGSTLEFLKTLQAEGTIKFEGDLTNPNLNITATYKDYYFPTDTTTSGGQEVPVAVKIKITGPVKDLGKNFIKEENNIAVYYGADNIDNNTPDPTKDASDATSFLLFGRFFSEMTPQDKNAASNQISKTATSMAGSVIGGFLNSSFGNYVRNLELRQVGTATRFNLSGSVNKFRYTIGGTTDIFQDLSQANIKIEYPILNSLLIRLERRQAIIETNSLNEMIDELGLKYRFEF